MEPCEHQLTKRHARLRHRPGTQPLWVGDPDDWAVVRQQPRPPLVCPEPGCDIELISYENPNNQYNPRIFKFKSSGKTCDHWLAAGGGGPPSAEHEWLKLYLARTAAGLGYTTTAEHPPTRADVYVHECHYCLEVQLRATQFRKRTASREGKGANVCWFIRQGLDTEITRKAVFGLPAVRFRVVDNSGSHKLIAPWDDPEKREVIEQAGIQVFGTVAYLERPQSAQYPLSFRTKTIDGRTFLDEILSGRRRWYRPNMLGRKSALWALKSEVSTYFVVKRMQKASS